MPDTRRSFIQAAALAAGATQAPAQVTPPAGRGGATPGQAPGPGQAGRGGAPGGAMGGRGGGAETVTLQTPVSEVQVPKMKFGKFEVSRLSVGYNPFHGMAHYTQTLNSMMGNFYTHERVVETLHHCTRFGINTCAITPSGRSVYDHEAFQREGGKMNIIFQGPGDPNHPAYKALQPMAIYHHGENTDRFFQTGEMDQAKEWCKKTRDTGVMVGVGSHKPEAISQVLNENWDVDFFVCCVYNRTRTEGQRRALLGGENPIGELYLVDDPPRMYKVIRQTTKPCFAFKILAAGRVPNVEAAFKQAFDSIKPTDGVIVGVYNQLKDQVRENAQIVHKLLVKS